MKKTELKKLIKECIISIPSINLREDEDYENENGYLCDDDGWDEDELDNVGLTDVLATFSKIQYELKNGRRGGYAMW